LAARDDRIQAERELIYAAREFEDFRRRYLFDIAVDFLDLVVQQMRIDNAERQLASFEWLERRQREMVRGGRAAKVEELLAAQGGRAAGGGVRGPAGGPGHALCPRPAGVAARAVPLVRGSLQSSAWQTRGRPAGDRDGDAQASTAAGHDRGSGAAGAALSAG